MGHYIIKRVLLFIPTLLGISFITFFLSVYAPGNPAQRMMESYSGKGDFQYHSQRQEYIRLRRELNLHLPLFYFNCNSWAYSDTLHRIPFPAHQYTLNRLSYQFGNWPVIQAYYQELRRLNEQVQEIPPPNSESIKEIRQLIQRLFRTYEPEQIQQVFQQITPLWRSIKATHNKQSLSRGGLKELKQSFKTMKRKATPWKRYIPTFTFYGLNNRYHQWITRFISGDFGISYQHKRPVISIVEEGFQWTLLLTLSAVLIIFLVSIPLGITAAQFRGQRTDNIISFLLFALYSLPNFWIATLLIMFLGGGDFLDWFPAFGVGNLQEEASWWQHFIDTAYHFTLPLICLTYSGFAFLTRQMRGSMVEVLQKKYIRTARAKGLPESKVIGKHAFKNALLPIITVLGNVFPFLLTGSFVIEYIFSIPGLGQLTYKAILAQDFPVVMTIVMLVSIVTLIGYLIADLLYAWVDPRIKYTRS